MFDSIIQKNNMFMKLNEENCKLNKTTCLINAIEQLVMNYETDDDEIADIYCLSEFKEMGRIIMEKHIALYIKRFDEIARH